jgi:cephalosporin hydroxylase
VALTLVIIKVTLMQSCKYKSISIGCDVYVMHPEGVASLCLIRDMITDLQPELMIELGTAYGGFTAVMLDGCESAYFYTYDKFVGEQILNRSRHLVTKEMVIAWRRELKKKGVQFIQKDIIIEPCSALEDLCSDGRRKLLYCDNGNKPYEIAFYGPHLVPGDVMGVHDWDTEVFPDKAPVKSVLENFFRQHSINKKLRSIKSLSRFFVRK